MSGKKLIPHCYITKISFFSESSASINILSQEGLIRVIALSFTKKYDYDLSYCLRSLCSVEVIDSSQNLYLSRLSFEKPFEIPGHRLYLLLFIRDLTDYLAVQYFSTKIFNAYNRFFDLLEKHSDEDYYYYALISYQLLFMELAGLGSASVQLRTLFTDNVLSLQEIENFYLKKLTFSSFMKIQNMIDSFLEQDLGYVRPRDYFSIWSKVV